MADRPKNPHPLNSASWWLFDRIASKRDYIAALRADIERAERSINEAERVIEALERDEADLSAGRAAREGQQ